MIRQYVGARYVPKFASPVAWDSGTGYEALTIVTYNNSSYTSKVPVPATVGNPADNPDYWALTGNYNAQVEQYRQETENLKIITENYNAQVEQYRQETENVKINYSKCFNTAANMIADTSLTEGMIVKTLGYNKIADNGGAFYKIYNTKEQNSEHYENLSNGKYALLVPNVYITPEMFGAVGDGVTDDTEAITKVLQYKNVLGTNEYAISKPIYAQLNKYSNIVLNLKAIKQMDYMLWLDAKGSSWNNLVSGSFAINLDCNLLSNDGLRIDRFLNSSVNVSVKNFLANAVYVRYNNLACGQNRINVDASNLETSDTVSEKTVALVSGQDDIYSVFSENVKTAVSLKHGGNLFNIIHAWTSTELWFDKSVVLELGTDSKNDIDELICDTMQVLFKLDNSGDFKYPKLNVTHFSIYNNSHVTSQPIYIWWLQTKNVFSPAITGLFINTVNNYVSFGKGTVPNVLIGENGTVTDITDSDNARLAVLSSVVKFKNLNVTGKDIDYLFNCENCFYTLDSLLCTLNAYVSNNSMVDQILTSTRASAHRSRPANATSWGYPWVDNSFKSRDFLSTVTFASGTLTYKITDLSSIYGILGDVIVAVNGTFMNVTSQPRIYIDGASIYVKVTEEWITNNTGTKGFFGNILTNGTIS